MATVSMWPATSQSTSAGRAGGKVSKTRTGSAALRWPGHHNRAGADVPPCSMGRASGSVVPTATLGGAWPVAWPPLQCWALRSSPIMSRSSLTDRGRRHPSASATSAEVTRDGEPWGSAGSITPMPWRVFAAGRRLSCEDTRGGGTGTKVALAGRDRPRSCAVGADAVVRAAHAQVVRSCNKGADTAHDGFLPIFLSMISELDSNLTVIPIMVLSSYGSG
jgi:hypothetical protein